MLGQAGKEFFCWRKGSNNGCSERISKNEKGPGWLLKKG